MRVRISIQSRWRLFEDLVSDGLLVGLATILLIMYFEGLWGDSLTWVNALEPVLLFAAAAFGLSRYILRVKEVKDDKRIQRIS